MMAGERTLTPLLEGYYVTSKLKIRYVERAELPSYGVWECGSCHNPRLIRCYEVGGVRHMETCSDREARVWEFGPQAIDNGGPGLGPTSVTLADMKRAATRRGEVVAPTSADIVIAEVEIFQCLCDPHICPCGIRVTLNHDPLHNSCGPFRHAWRCPRCGRPEWCKQ